MANLIDVQVERTTLDGVKVSVDCELGLMEFNLQTPGFDDEGCRAGAMSALIHSTLAPVMHRLADRAMR